MKLKNIQFQSIIKMKSTRTSLKLQKITRPSSVNKQSSTSYSNNDTFKLASINSSNRGIKFNDLQSLTRNDLKKFCKQTKNTDGLYFQAIHQSLTDIRSHYDEIKKKREEKQTAIKKLKNEIAKYRTYQQELQQKINQSKNVVAHLSETKINKKYLFVEREMDRKILENMKKRYNKDKVIYDQRKFDLEKQLTYLHKQIQIFTNDGVSISQQSDRANKIYRKFVSQLQEQALYRENHLKNVLQIIQSKHTCATINKIRSEEIADISQRVILDKNLDEKQWMRICLANLFVQKFLRNKIQKQMKKFQIVEKAFQQIKRATVLICLLQGVSDGRSLVDRYMNKQSTYGELKSRISQNQQQIQLLKYQRQQLNKQAKQLELEKQAISNVKIEKTQLRNELKELEYYQTKKNKASQFKQMLKNWITKQSKVFNLSKNQKVQNSIVSLKKGMKVFCEIIQKQLEQLAYKQQNQINPEDISLISPTNFSQKVQQKISYESDDQFFSQSFESMCQLNKDEQNQIMSIERNKLLKNNQIFQKNLRTRKLEERKLKMEKLYQIEKKQKVRVGEMAYKLQ